MTFSWSRRSFGSRPPTPLRPARNRRRRLCLPLRRPPSALRVRQRTDLIRAASSSLPSASRLCRQPRASLLPSPSLPPPDYLGRACRSPRASARQARQRLRRRKERPRLKRRGSPLLSRRVRRRSRNRSSPPCRPGRRLLSSLRLPGRVSFAPGLLRGPYAPFPRCARGEARYSPFARLRPRTQGRPPRADPKNRQDRRPPKARRPPKPRPHPMCSTRSNRWRKKWRNCWADRDRASPRA